MSTHFLDIKGKIADLQAVLHNCDTEQFTFTCKNCRHRFTYNFSDLYNILK